MCQQPDKGSDQNVCGSELWGMARSAVSEGAHSNITLVDMTFSEVNMTALRILLKEKPNGYSEFMIKDGKCYYLEVTEANEHEIPSRREINSDISEDMILKSPSTSSFTDAYYDARTHEFSKRSKVKHCKIQLKSICLHNSSIFPISMSEAKEEDIYKNRETNGYTLLCVEGVGSLHDESKDKNDLTAKIGFCCPVYVSPVVCIPQECVCDLTSLSVYVPGMLSVGVILWNIVEACTKLLAENVLVIVDDDVGDWIQLIRTILTDQSLSAKIESKNQLPKMSPNCDIDTIAILTQVTKLHFDIIEKIFPAVKHIVSIDEYFSKRQKIFMDMSGEERSFSILKVEDMFAYSELIEKVPKIYKSFEVLGNVTLSPCRKDLLLEDNTVPKKSILDLPHSVLPLYDESGRPRIPLKVSQENIFRKNGCYILVGGLSGLGWELLQLLSKLGTKYIATLSRRLPTDQNIKEIKQIEETYGCQVLCLQGDISDQGQVKEAFEKLRKRFGKQVDIRGIFHGAGVIRDNFLRDMSEEDRDDVLLPKVLGTWNLHQASLSLKLDFFIMHSSIVSVFGNQKQCNYAAGNSFQDSFALYRRSLGLCGQSINWGPLPFGMAKEDTKLENHLINQGFHFLTKYEVHDCFIAALMTNDVQLMFGRFDWRRLRQQTMLHLNPNKFANIMEMNPTTEMEHEKSDVAKYVDNFFKKDSAKQNQMVHELITSRIANTFVIDESTLSESSKLVELGIDSLSAMNFVADIYQNTKVNIPLWLLYNGSTTLKDLSSFIVTRMLKEAEKEQVDETLCKYFEGDITFMQKSLLDDFDKNPFSRNIMRQVDFELSGLTLTKKDLKIVFDHLLLNNPDLRRTFTREDSTYYPVVHRSQEVEINIEDVELNSICEEDSIDKRGETRMDITEDIPIRAMASFKGRKTRVRMFIHAIVGDLAAITNIFRDIGNTLKCHLQQQPLPFKETNMNSAKILKDTLIPQMNTLKRFWSSYLNEDVSPFTFSDFSVETEETSWTDISQRLPADLYERMMKFINSQGISLYNFLISVYMVLLHDFTGNSLIPLVTWVDMRAHIKQLQSSMQSCSNAVPVVGDLRQMGPVTTYLKRSSDQLYKITQHSAYPYELIQAEMKSEELKMHIGRHRFIMENMTNLNNNFRYENVVLEIGRPFYKRHSYETSLHIEYDTQQKFVDLQFGFNRKLMAERYSRQVLPRMVQLIDKMEQEPHAEIHSLLIGN